MPRTTGIPAECTQPGPLGTFDRLRFRVPIPRGTSGRARIPKAFDLRGCEGASRARPDGYL